MLLAVFRGSATAAKTHGTGRAQAQYRAAFLPRAYPCPTPDLSKSTEAFATCKAACRAFDHRLSKAFAPSDPGKTGERFFKKAAAFLLRSKNDHVRAEQVERAVTNPAMTGIATWATELTDTVGGLLLAISKQSAYAAIAARTPPFSVGPEQQRIVIGGEITAGFIGEGQATGVSKGAFSSQTLTPKKIASICVITDELERSAANIEAMLRQLMGAGISTALDSVFFGTAAASSAAPAGILERRVGDDAERGHATVRGHAARLASLDRRAHLTVRSGIRHVAEPLGLCVVGVAERFAYPMFASSALPPTRVISVDAGALVAAHAAEPRFSVSANATMHMDTAAAAIGGPVRRTS